MVRSVQEAKDRENCKCNMAKRQNTDPVSFGGYMDFETAAYAAGEARAARRDDAYHCGRID